MNRPFPSRHSQSGPNIRINGKIRAREVRVIGDSGEQVGVLPLVEAINLARSRGVDLVEIAPNADPPVCRIVDYGKYKYEQEKRQKDSRKHQHANKVKEIQLSATIDPHDFSVKLGHAIEFLCEEMKVKASLRFRGREMAHTEFGFQVVQRFLEEIALWGHPDAAPRLNGRSVNVMISPLPRGKRAKRPDESGDAGGLSKQAQASPPGQGSANAAPNNSNSGAPGAEPAGLAEDPQKAPAGVKATGFANKPFANLEMGERG